MPSLDELRRAMRGDFEGTRGLRFKPGRAPVAQQQPRAPVNRTGRAPLTEKEQAALQLRQGFVELQAQQISRLLLDPESELTRGQREELKRKFDFAATLRGPSPGLISLGQPTEQDDLRALSQLRAQQTSNQEIDSFLLGPSSSLPGPASIDALAIDQRNTPGAIGLPEGGPGDEAASAALHAHQQSRSRKAIAHSLEISEQLGKTATPRALNIARQDFLQQYPDFENLVPVPRSPEEIQALKQKLRLQRDQETVNKFTQDAGLPNIPLTMGKDGFGDVAPGVNQAIGFLTRAKADERANESRMAQVITAEFKAKLGAFGPLPKMPQSPGGGLPPNAQAMEQWREQVEAHQDNLDGLFRELRRDLGIGDDRSVGQTPSITGPTDAVPTIRSNTAASEFKFASGNVNVTSQAQATADRKGFPVVSTQEQWDAIKDKPNVWYIDSATGDILNTNDR